MSGRPRTPNFNKSGRPKTPNKYGPSGGGDDGDGTAGDAGLLDTAMGELGNLKANTANALGAVADQADVRSRWGCARARRRNAPCRPRPSSRARRRRRTERGCGAVVCFWVRAIAFVWHGLPAATATQRNHATAPPYVMPRDREATAPPAEWLAHPFCLFVWFSRSLDVMSRETRRLG